MTEKELTIEEKKEILKNFKIAKEKLKSLESQKISLAETMTSAKAQQYNDMPKSNRHNDLSDSYCMLEKLIDNIENATIEYIAIKVRIEFAIMKLKDGIECNILRKRYIEYEKYKCWEEISADIGYSMKQTHRKHSDALIKIKL